MSRPAFRPASVGDVPALLRLQAEYYAAEVYPFDERVAREAWRALLDDERLGSAWVAENGEQLVGYAVLTLGYSLEYRGRDAFVDELYLAEGWRGRGLGTQALEVLEAACARAGVKALHLEVERGNRRARALYRRWGFDDHERILMTKPIGA